MTGHENMSIKYTGKMKFTYSLRVETKTKIIYLSVLSYQQLIFTDLYMPENNTENNAKITSKVPDKFSKR